MFADEASVSSNQPARTGNSPLIPFAMNSTAIAARISPMIRVKALIPVAPRRPAIQGAILSAIQIRALKATMLTPSITKWLALDDLCTSQDYGADRPGPG